MIEFFGKTFDKVTEVWINDVLKPIPSDKKLKDCKYHELQFDRDGLDKITEEVKESNSPLIVVKFPFKTGGMWTLEVNIFRFAILSLLANKNTSVAIVEDVTES